MPPRRIWINVIIVMAYTLCVGPAMNCEAILYSPTPKSNVSEFINYKSHREQQLIRSLLKNYQKTLRPPGVSNANSSSDGEPVRVYASIEILSLSSFNDVTMTFACQFRLKQEWVDSRLAHNDSYFQSDEFLILAKDQHIWEPDTFFQNEQSGHAHDIDQSNVYLKISSDGRVKYNKRLTMAFSCPMNLLLFPHDSQTCHIDFASYAYTSNDIMYVWNNPAIEKLATAVDAMPKFSIEGVDNASCTTTTTTERFGVRLPYALSNEPTVHYKFMYIDKFNKRLNGLACACPTLSSNEPTLLHSNLDKPPNRGSMQALHASIIFCFLGTYICLRVILQLRREVSFFLLQLYLPSCMMVAVGCVSFWIDWRSAPARVPLAIVTLLTITTQAHGINANLPPVSYTKAIDVWIGACVVFIFGALLEFAVVNYVGTNEEKRKAKRRDCVDGKGHSINSTSIPKYATANGVSPETTPDHRRHLRHRQAATGRTKSASPLLTTDVYLDEEARGDCFDADEYVAYRERMTRRRRRRDRSVAADASAQAAVQDDGPLRMFSSPMSAIVIAPNSTRAEQIDMISRILFPIGFLLFNVVYWALYIPLMR